MPGDGPPPGGRPAPTGGCWRGAGPTAFGVAALGAAVPGAGAPPGGVRLAIPGGGPTRRSPSDGRPAVGGAPARRWRRAAWSRWSSQDLARPHSGNDSVVGRSAARCSARGARGPLAARRRGPKPGGRLLLGDGIAPGGGVTVFGARRVRRPPMFGARRQGQAAAISSARSKAVRRAARCIRRQRVPRRGRKRGHQRDANQRRQDARARAAATAAAAAAGSRDRPGVAHHQRPAAVAD